MGIEYGFNGLKYSGKKFSEEPFVSISDKEASTLKREELKKRNIYTPDNIYDISNPLISKTINDLANFIFPNSGDLRNNLLLRNLPPVTPLVRIGNEKLLQELKHRLISGFQREKLAEIIPSLNLNNVFDGNPETKLLEKKYDYKITNSPIKKSENLIDKLKFEGLPFIQEILGLTFPSSPLSTVLEPNTEAGQTDLFLNTGDAVLTILSKSQSYNIYSKHKGGLPENIPPLQRLGWTSSNFKFDGETVYDYFGERTIQAVDFVKSINKDAKANVFANGNRTNELPKFANYGNDSKIDEDTGEERDIIWGVDTTEDIDQKFGAKRGLLYYTSKYMSEAENSFQHKLNTRNFTNNVESDDDKKGNRGNFTCRIHTKVDQYNYSPNKAIRFYGNDKEYSPLKNTVKPIISPITQANQGNTWVSYKNVMFSIENLAWNRQDLINAGLDGTCEEGTLGGRIMWFPPYDLSISESTSSNWDSTSFIGRGEPVYTYNNSERTLNISFKLIMDYPEIIDLDLKGATSEQIAKFFACGVIENDYVPEKEPEKIIVIKEEEKEEPIKPPKIDLKAIFKFNNDVPVLPNTWDTEITSLFNSSAPLNVDNLRSKLKKFKLETSNYGRTWKRNGYKYDVKNLNESYSPDKVKYKGAALNDRYYGYYWEKAGITYSGYTNTVKPYDLKSAPIIEYKIKDDYFGRAIPSGSTIYYQSPINDSLPDQKKNLNFDKLLDEDIDKLINTFVPPKPTGQILTISDSDSLNLAINTGVNTIELKKKVDEFEESAKYRYTPEDYELQFIGFASKLSNNKYNYGLGYRRAIALYQEFNRRMKEKTGKTLEEIGFPDKNIRIFSGGEESAKSVKGELDANANLEEVIDDRYAKVVCVFKGKIKKRIVKVPPKTIIEQETNITKDLVIKQKKKPCGYDYQGTNMMNNLADKGKYYHHAFHSQTPEDFHRRLTFLQQCMRQGSSVTLQSGGNKVNSNTVFGRQPFCILNIADLFKAKIIIDNLSLDYNVSTVNWDLNPEGMGMQPMVASVTLSCKIVGGMSMKAPIEVIQNAISFNYYKNSTFYGKGRDKIYDMSAEVEEKQRKLYAIRGNKFYSDN